MIGYDDLYSIQYFGKNLMPYWKRNGQVTIEQEFAAAEKDYRTILGRCDRFDRELMDEAAACGGKEYAELCALVYRQAIAAHKLVVNGNGECSSRKKISVMVRSVQWILPILLHLYS